MGKKYATYIIAGVIILILFALYSHHLYQSLFYHPDFARDLYEILSITQGKLTLIGPKLTFGGLYTGPYYFYIFAPIFFLFHANIMSVMYFNAFLYTAAAGYFYYKLQQRYSIVKSITAAIALAISPLFVIGARNPSNAYLYVALFSFLMTYIYFNKLRGMWELLLTGFLFGVIINFHFINVIFILPLIFFVYYFLEDKRRIVFFVTGILTSFAPLILFEFKHDFVIFKNTFIDKSYKKWIDNTNIPGQGSGKKNVLSNVLFMADQLRGFIGHNPLISYTLLGFAFFVRKLGGKEFVLFGASLTSFLLFCAVIRFQFISHYLFGVAFFMLFILIICLLRTRLWMLLFVLIALEAMAFPSFLYAPSWRRPERFDQAVKYVIDHNLIKKGEDFNVMQITKENLLATIGFEYRFFLRKYGYVPQTEFEYDKSKVLIIFSEIKDYDITKLGNWESGQFGRQYLNNAQNYEENGITIYRIAK